MYLSKYRIDIRNPSVRVNLQNPQEMHRSIMSAFLELQGEEQRSAGKILYRLFYTDKETILFLSSVEKPNSETLAQRGLVLQGTIETERMKDLFQEGTYWNFDLLSMPSKKIIGEGKNSKRVYLTQSTERMNWLQKKGLQNGFTLISVQEFEEQKHVLNRNEVRFGFTATRFIGVLKVDNIEMFWNAYTSGVGPEKAYGLGMLLVKKLEV